MNHGRTRGSQPTLWLDEIDDNSSDDDDDLSPGQLIIDTADAEDGTSGRKRKDGTASSTPSPSCSRSSTASLRSQQPIVIRSEEKLKESDFKGLTFVGRMEVNPMDGPPDNICLYSYHWGNTHLDIITRNQADTLIPMKNVYQRVVLGLTRNAVSNRVPKIGAKTIALPESYIGVLKKLQLPITARSHYLLVVDFIQVCRYYGHRPPPNLSNFAFINSLNDPAEVLKSFNSQNPILAAPMLAPQRSPSDDLGVLSPGRLNASLVASSGGMPESGHLLSSSATWRVQERNESGRREERTPSEASQVEVHSLHLPSGQQMALLMRDSTPYFLNSDLSIILPSANQSNISSVRHNLGIPLEHASRVEMNALKSASMVGMKAGRVVIYKAADVVKMFGYWMRGVPHFVHEICSGQIPKGIVDIAPTPFHPSTPTSPGKRPKSEVVSPSLPSSAGRQVVPPLKIKLESGIANSSGQTRERRPSHSGQPPLHDQELDYVYLPWGESKTITLLCAPNEEPHVAIAELVDKIFDQRSQISLQRRTKLGISTVPATSLQIHALRARGSIDPSSGYSKLVPLSGVVRLAKEAGIHVPQGILDECQKHITESIEELLARSSLTSQQSSPSSSKKKESNAKRPLAPGPLVQLRRDIVSHPDVILLGKEFQNSDGVLFQLYWGKAKITLFTSARRITYVGLFQIYDMLFKNLTPRMNFKMRMRKFNVKSIRAPSSVRVNLIKLNSLPPSSPVCGLIRIPEMERLAKSYGLTPPKVFYDLFLNKLRLQEEQRSFEEEVASRGGEQPVLPATGSTLIVSIPKESVSLSPYPDSGMADASSLSGYNSRSHPAFGHFTYHNKTSVLQNLAKKISQKNHRLASAASSSAMSGGTKTCTSCGRSNPILKKRCQHCQVFLIGRPCRSCQTMNHNRSALCIKCGSAMEPDKGGGDIQHHLQITDGSPEKAEHADSHRPKRSRSNSSSSESQSSPSHGPMFNPPPIRTAVLKKMFPEEGGPSSAGVVALGACPGEDAGSSGSVSTKTISMYSGSLASSRRCLDCATLNSRMAKKCVNCKAPLQGRPCPRCSRPNHNHSSECYKCGGPLPPTATKWIIGNKIFKSSQDSAAVSPLKKAANARAPISCIRCRRIRQKGKLKCGRCGEFYNVSPVFNLAGGLATRRRDPLHPPSQDDAILLSFAHNLVTAGVGAELSPALAEVEKESREKLEPVEDEFEEIDEEYQTVLNRKTDAESLLQTLESEHSRLLIEVESLNSKLQNLLTVEDDAKTLVESDPKAISQLENRLDAVSTLLSEL